MDKVPVYLNENLIIGQVYYLRQVFMVGMQPFLLVYINTGQFKNKWNTTNNHKFEIFSMTYDGVYCTIRGMSKNADSFNVLNIDMFFQNKYTWIMSCSDVNAYYLGTVDPEESPENILRDEETKKMFKKITTVILVIIIGAVLIFTIPKIFKRIKKR